MFAATTRTIYYHSHQKRASTNQTTISIHTLLTYAPCTAARFDTHSASAHEYPCKESFYHDSHSRLRNRPSTRDSQSDRSATAFTRQASKCSNRKSTATHSNHQRQADSHSNSIESPALYSNPATIAIAAFKDRSTDSIASHRSSKRDYWTRSTRTLGSQVRQPSDSSNSNRANSSRNHRSNQVHQALYTTCTRTS